MCRRDTRATRLAKIGDELSGFGMYHDNLVPSFDEYSLERFVLEP